MPEEIPVKSDDIELSDYFKRAIRKEMENIKLQISKDVVREVVSKEVQDYNERWNRLGKLKVEEMMEALGKLGNVWFSKAKAEDMWYCNIGEEDDKINSCSGLDARRAVTNLYLYCLEKGMFTNKNH